MSSTWYKIWMQQSKILLKWWSFTEMGWFLFELINRSKCCWWFQGFDEYSLLMKEVRQVIALHMKDSLQKSISVMKQSLMVLVPNASCLNFLPHIFHFSLKHHHRMHMTNKKIRDIFYLQLSANILYHPQVVGSTVSHNKIYFIYLITFMKFLSSCCC